MAQEYNGNDSGGTENAKPKKKRLWLWVLGWICIFPVPLTILMLRNKKLNKGVRIAIIAIGWIIYLAAIFGGNSSSKTDETTAAETTVAETTTAQETTEKATEATTEAPSGIDVTLEVKPNVNTEDGTVLFGVTTNLPEGTKLMVTVSNDNGYTAQDTATILANGTGYTAEFSDKGDALNGDYNVNVSMSLPKLQAENVQEVIGANGENITGQYVQKDDTTGANVVSGDFKFTFDSSQAADPTAGRAEYAEESPIAESESAADAAGEWSHYVNDDKHMGNYVAIMQKAVDYYISGVKWPWGFDEYSFVDYDSTGSGTIAGTAHVEVKNVTEKQDVFVIFTITPDGERYTVNSVSVGDKIYQDDGKLQSLLSAFQ